MDAWRTPRCVGNGGVVLSGPILLARGLPRSARFTVAFLAHSRNARDSVYCEPTDRHLWRQIEDQYRRISLLGQPLSYIPSQGAVPLWPISKRAAKGAALSPNLQVVIPSRIFGTVVDFPKAVRRMDEPSRNGNS